MEDWKASVYDRYADPALHGTPIGHIALTDPANTFSVLAPFVTFPLMLFGAPAFQPPPLLETLKVAQPLGPVSSYGTIELLNGLYMTRFSGVEPDGPKLSVCNAICAPIIGCDG